MMGGCHSSLTTSTKVFGSKCVCTGTHVCAILHWKLFCSSDYLEDGVEFEVIGENPAESLGEGKGKNKVLPVAGIKRRTIDEREEREPKKKKKEDNASVGDDDDEDIMIVE